MAGSLDKSAIYFLVTGVCVTSGILTTNVSPNSSRPVHLPPPPNSYLPPADDAITKQPPRVTYAAYSPPNRLANRNSSIDHVDVNKRVAHDGPRPRGFALSYKGREKWEFLRSFERSTGERASRFPENAPPPGAEINRDAPTTTPKSTTARARPAEYHRDARRRSSYRVIEAPYEDLADEPNRGRRPYRGKHETGYRHRDEQDVTEAIKALDRFLSGTLNDRGYNTELHPPPNPVLALLLSRYGRYVPGARNSRVYSYMAVNNIHNNKPFGSYKYECDDNLK